MEFETKKERLEEVVTKASRISGKNLSLPVLECLLLETKNNTLIIRSTNLELGVEFEIPVKVKQEGKVAISANVLSQFINSLPNDLSIMIQTKDGVLNLKTDITETGIKTQEVEDFPTLPQVNINNSFEINSRELINGLKSVWFSASVSNVKPDLASVCLFTKDNYIYFISTDSFRLAEKKIYKKQNKDIDLILIPYKNIPEIIRLLDNIEDQEAYKITINIDNNQLSLSNNNLYLTSRLIDGNFPDYGQIIPKSFETTVIVLKEDLSNALKVGNIFSDEFKKITFKIDPNNKKILLNTQNIHIGQNNISISGSIEGQEIEISFNYKYIIDVFQSINSDSVSLEFAGQGKPLVIKGVSDNSFLYLVMPMNK